MILTKMKTLAYSIGTKLLLAAGIVLPLASHGFTLSATTGDGQGWADPNVKFLVNTTNCPAGIDVPGLITEAAKLWNNVPTSRINVTYGGPTTSTSDTSPPTVYCATNFGAVSGADEGQTVGVGRGSPSVLGGPITSGLLILNASAGGGSIANQTPEVLKAIVAHEIGHVLGLGHSQEPSALMWYTAGAKTNALLSQDDVDGISYLYPRNELGQDQPFGCGLVKSIGAGGGVLPPAAPTSAAILAMLIALLLPILLALQLRLFFKTQSRKATFKS
ncbi:MAG: matrixin family metalloprotease [Bdellovibrionales bacterium]|nr:matrixin family metalloprotease [Bdellovibrionales bacterium]